jgi:hypothetical protein
MQLTASSSQADSEIESGQAEMAATFSFLEADKTTAVQVFATPEPSAFYLVAGGLFAFLLTRERFSTKSN